MPAGLRSAKICVAVATRRGCERRIPPAQLHRRTVAGSGLQGRAARSGKSKCGSARNAATIKAMPASQLLSTRTHPEKQPRHAGAQGGRRSAAGPSPKSAREHRRQEKPRRRSREEQLQSHAQLEVLEDEARNQGAHLGAQNRA